jgi:hypothetical protein
MKTNIFKNTIVSVALLGIVVLLSGCPFSGNVPIDNGTVAISDKLVGEWVKPGDRSEENPTTYLISKNDKYHATALKMEYSTTDTKYDTTIYNLTFSDVEGETFMNAQEKSSTTYYYYKFSLDQQSDEITLYEVSDYIKETFDKSKDLRDFIAKNKSLSFFFTNTTENYERK